MKTPDHCIKFDQNSEVYSKPRQASKMKLHAEIEKPLTFFRKESSIQDNWQGIRLWN